MKSWYGQSSNKYTLRPFQFLVPILPPPLGISNGIDYSILSLMVPIHDYFHRRTISRDGPFLMIYRHWSFWISTDSGPNGCRGSDGWCHTYKWPFLIGQTSATPQWDTTKVQQVQSCTQIVSRGTPSTITLFDQTTPYSKQTTLYIISLC